MRLGVLNERSMEHRRSWVAELAEISGNFGGDTARVRIRHSRRVLGTTSIDVSDK